MRQPNVCSCFGGRCWKYLCPNNPRSKVKRERSDREHTQPKYYKGKDPREGKILTLSESLKQRENDKNE